MLHRRAQTTSAALPSVLDTDGCVQTSLHPGVSELLGMAYKWFLAAVRPFVIHSFIRLLVRPFIFNGIVCYDIWIIKQGLKWTHPTSSKAKKVKWLLRGHEETRLGSSLLSSSSSILSLILMMDKALQLFVGGKLLAWTTSFSWLY